MVVYDVGAKAFFTVYEVSSRSFNRGYTILVGSHVYENSSYTAPQVAIQVRGVDLSHADIIYNPAISGFNIAFQTHLGAQRGNAVLSALAYIVKVRGKLTVVSSGVLPFTDFRNTTSPRLAWDSKHSGIYLVFEADKNFFLISRKPFLRARCNRQSDEDRKSERFSGEVFVVVIKFVANRFRYIRLPVRFGTPHRRNNGLSIYYDTSRDRAVFSYTTRFRSGRVLRHSVWLRSVHISPFRLRSEVCKLFSKEASFGSRPVRNPAAVFSPVNRASFVIYEAQKRSRRWMLATAINARSVEKWNYDAPLLPVVIFDNNCECFLICWQNWCGDTIQCQRFSPLRSGYCKKTSEGECLSRDNRRPSCEESCKAHNATTHCTACAFDRYRLDAKPSPKRIKGSPTPCPCK